MSSGTLEDLLVVGAGQMGQGIAQVAAQAGFRVKLADTSAARAEAGCQAVLDRWGSALRKGKLDASTLGDLSSRLVAGALEAATPSTVAAIEAVVEDLAVKLEVFRALDDACPPGCLLLTNTSSISVTRLAAATRRPQDVAGMHFMNPVPVMRLVEVVRGEQTSSATLSAVRALAGRFGKTVVESRDRPGFIVNRVLIPLLNEACFALEEGVASAVDIDQAVRLGLNHPMGPLQLADHIGLDTVLAIAEVLHRDFGDDKYRPCVYLRNLVAAGRLGRKSSHGFYRYDPAGNLLQ